MTLSPDLLDPAGRISLVNSSAQLLRSRITHGEWPLGSKIPIEAELAKRLKVSRSTVREAVRILAVQGLLDVRQGAGTFVRATAVANDVERRLGRATLRDQFEARLGLEVEAVRLGSLRHSPRTIATLHALLDARGESNDARDKPGFVAHDHAFHVAVVAASKNEALINLYEFFSQSVSKTIAATLTGDIPEPDMAAHRSIIDAMASGDPERADATLRAFMSPILSTLNHMLAD